MAGMSGMLTSVVVSMLTSTVDGVNVRIAAIKTSDPSIQAIGIHSIIAQNASVDISEKTGQAVYPALFVYCDKVSNALKEKFWQFSGKAHMIVEVRHSQDQMTEIEANLAAYVDGVCALLDDSRGDWGNGAIYGGGYEVSYEPVGRGGKNFLQRAKVGFEVEVSK
jgi:hypothetical protein